MKNINFLYEFKTPLGFLPIGYELNDLPMIFNEINEITEDKFNHIIRCIRGSGDFRISSSTVDVFGYLTEISGDLNIKITKRLVADLNNNNLSKDYNLFVIAPTHEEPVNCQINSLNFNDILTETSLKLLKEYESVKILILDNKEGAMEYADKFFDNIRNFVEHQKLDSNKIVFITNTSNIEEIYENYLSRNNLSTFMVCKDISFYVVQDVGKNIISYEMTTHNYELNKITERGDDYSLDQYPIKDKRKKHYLCLNRNTERRHRARLVLKLIQHDLFDKGLISFHKTEEFDRWAERPENIHYKLYIKDKYPFIIDYDDPDHVSKLHNFFSGTQMWNDTYFSVVNETSVDEPAIFITEKTIKPMTYFHPFIVYGNPGTLRELRKLGFETFPEFFDERYDEILDKHERLNAIITNVKKLCNIPLDDLHEMYHSVYPKLVHNRNLLANFSRNNYAFIKFLDILNI